MQSSECDPYQIAVREEPSRDVLVLGGVLDLNAAFQVHSEAIRLLDRSQDLVLDWSDAEYVSSSVIQILLALRTELNLRKRTLTVGADNPEVRTLLEWSGLSPHFVMAGPCE